MTIAQLSGISSIAGVTTRASGGEGFFAYNPIDGKPIEPAYFSASTEDVDAAVSAAQEAADFLAQSSGADRARLLRAIADGLDSAAESLIQRAMLETALPRPRLTHERPTPALCFGRRRGLVGQCAD